MAGRFALLTDEHIPRALVKALVERGWTALRVVDLEELKGQHDDVVFAYAVAHDYVVLSSDERALWRPKKYREEGSRFRGMVCWPQRHRDRMTAGEALEQLEALALEDDPFVYGFRFLQPR